MTERTAIPAMRSVLDAGVAMMNDRTLVSRRSMEVATALVTAAVGAAVMWGAAEHDIGWGDSGPASGYFPFRIGVLIVLGSLANLILDLRRRGLGQGRIPRWRNRPRCAGVFRRGG